MEYTKGEWKLVQIRSGALAIVCGIKNIAETSQATHPNDAPEILANAHLIAAAPDMYEALKYARRLINECDHDIAFIAKALAKAEGE